MRPFIVLACFAAGCALAFATGAPQARPTSTTCGVERWTVKTLQDRPTLLPAKLVTVHYLVTRLAPASLPSRRLPFERHAFTVFARVTLVRAESGGDFHLVLQSGPFAHDCRVAVVVLHDWSDCGAAPPDGDCSLTRSALRTRQGDGVLRSLTSTTGRQAWRRTRSRFTRSSASTASTGTSCPNHGRCERG
jgi:hypothetical protein